MKVNRRSKFFWVIPVLLLYRQMEIKEFKYSANFCEENIWYLCQNPALESFSKRVLIVSNSKRNCPFRFQKSINNDEIVRWNYHVILFASKKGESLIYDFDSTLAVPLSGKKYLETTFHANGNWGESDEPYFKSINSKDYINTFFSDRSHMKDSVGNWLSEPPDWPAIGKGGGLALQTLLDFTGSCQERIYTLNEILALVEVFDESAE
jgi:protein N-terminal glutamine amidohydrolase